MIKFQQKQKENPFYGMSATLDLFQQAPKLGTNPSKSKVESYLTAAWKECKSAEQKKLFYSIVFSLGDIANREHNLFKKLRMKKVDTGGNSLRKVFIYSLNWMLTHSEETKNQFYTFLPIVSEYTNFENLFIYRLETDRYKGKVLNILKLPIDIEKVTDYLAKQIKSAKTPDVTHQLIAKFLPRDSAIQPRKRVKVVGTKKGTFFSKKLNKNIVPGDTFVVKTKILPETVKREQFRYKFLMSLSKKLDWAIQKHANNTEFIGVKAYKAKWNRKSETYLFSSKEILNLDKTQFLDWLSQLPAGARYRTQRHLLNKEGNNFVSNKKWVNKFGNDLGELFLDWEKSKVVAQETLLSLSDEDKKQMTKKDLRQLEKNAKVNVAGDTLINAIAKIKKGGISTEQAKLLSQSILDKIKLDVPVFVFTDVSSSMQGGWSGNIEIDGVSFCPLDIAGIATTAFLMKNPEPELKNILGIFSTKAQILSDYSYNVAGKMKNKYLHTAAKLSETPLIDKTKSFAENWQHINQVLRSYDFGSTRIDEVSKTLKEWAESDPEFTSERKEQVAKYPIHLYISDGDFNNGGAANTSLLQHRQNMKQWFGWDGLTIIWDVKNESKGDGAKFDGIPNTMYFGSNNISVLNQIFSNISDLDIIDSFLPLKALYLSDRYAPVRDLVKSELFTENKTKVTKSV